MKKVILIIAAILSPCTVDMLPTTSGVKEALEDDRGKQRNHLVTEMFTAAHDKHAVRWRVRARLLVEGKIDLANQIDQLSTGVLETALQVYIKEVPQEMSNPDLYADAFRVLHLMVNGYVLGFTESYAVTYMRLSPTQQQKSHEITMGLFDRIAKRENDADPNEKD